jgi:murein DD-endopeptidase MepM/ murein hydrolase activator NlpD
MLILCVFGGVIAWANGVNLSFPAARRYHVTQGYDADNDHLAYDYAFPNYTQVAAAKAGQVTASTWQYADGWRSDCNGFLRDRGNYIVMDHGGGVATHYYHLSNTGQTPGNGTSFDRGDYMALSDDIGCSTASHLHFALYVGGSARDPYAGTGEWAAGSPLPMGYCDQNHGPHGPFALDYSSIHQKWLDLNGEPGSPLDIDDSGTMAAAGTDEILYQVMQPFEHGQIFFETGYGTNYYPYTETYLPDVRAYKDSNGWNSNIFIRNNSNYPATVNFTFYALAGFSGSGHILESRTYTALPAQGVWAVNTREVLQDYLNEIYGLYPDLFEGSAIVYASQDVSVVVENQKNGMTELYNYSGILADGGSGSPGWEETGTVLYAPVIKRSYGSRSSTIRLANVGSQATTVWVDYYNDDPGSGRTLGPYTLSANESMNISPNGSGNGGCAATGTICSARIWSSNGQPLAGVVRERNDGDGLVVTTHNLFSAGAEQIYFPIAKYRFNNMTTGLRIQNVGSYDTTVVVSYYQQNGAFQCSRPSVSVPPLAAHTFMPDISCPPEGFLGSVVATADQRLVGMANEASESAPSRKKAYSSFQAGSHTAYGALVYRTYLQGGYTWDTGIGVQNLSTQAASVNLYYCDPYGNQVATQLNQTVNGRGVGVFFAPIGGFIGSVRITANQNIAAVVNVTNNASTGDTHAIYNASNR